MVVYVFFKSVPHTWISLYVRRRDDLREGYLNSDSKQVLRVLRTGTRKPKTRKSTRLGSGGRVFDSKIRWPTRTTRTRRAAAEKKLTAADGSENAPARRPGPAGRAPHEARGAGRLPPRCYVTKYTFIMLSVGPDARARREGSRRRKSRRRPDRGVPRGDFKSGT